MARLCLWKFIIFAIMTSSKQAKDGASLILSYIHGKMVHHEPIQTSSNRSLNGNFVYFLVSQPTKKYDSIDELIYDLTMPLSGLKCPLKIPISNRKAGMILARKPTGGERVLARGEGAWPDGAGSHSRP